jgi:hypothetical protein
MAAFLVPPPSGAPEEKHVWVRFAQFAITILVGLITLGMLRWKKKANAIRWGAISVVFLALGSIAFYTYQFFTARWTANYAGQPVVIGATYTAWGKEYHEQDLHLSAGDLLNRFAGRVDQIWTKESLEQRRLILAGMYVLVLPLFTISVMSIVQALQCAAAAKQVHKHRPRASKPSRHG